MSQFAFLTYVFCVCLFDACVYVNIRTQVLHTHVRTYLRTYPHVQTHANYAHITYLYNDLKSMQINFICVHACRWTRVSSHISPSTIQFEQMIKRCNGDDSEPAVLAMTPPQAEHVSLVRYRVPVGDSVSLA